MLDLNVITGLDVLGLSKSQETKKADQSTNERAGKDLEMSDFLNLMMVTLQNQTIDNTADTNQMMEQMVQMSVMTAVNNLTELLNQSTAMNYGASLVGKEVTIGQQVGQEVKELVGTITGTGTLNGEQVVFIGDKSYYLSDVLAVGRIPAKKEDIIPEEEENEQGG